MLEDTKKSPWATAEKLRQWTEKIGEQMANGVEPDLPICKKPGVLSHEV